MFACYTVKSYGSFFISIMIWVEDIAALLQHYKMHTNKCKKDRLKGTMIASFQGLVLIAIILLYAVMQICGRACKNRALFFQFLYCLTFIADQLWL